LDLRVGISLAHVVADRTHEVRLPESGPAVHEQRVVHRPGRIGDRPPSRDGEAICRADDEVLEPKTGVELHDYLRLPALSRLSPSSEIDRSVSNPPGPWRASAENSGTPRKFSASDSSVLSRISSRGRSCLLY